MTAQDYPVEFGYLAQDGYYYGPNGTVGYQHLGNDRYTPTGVSVVVGGQVIGLTGATGMVGGPHLHTQAWVGSPTTGHRNPAPYEFKPGTVVAVGTNVNDQWGRYITINVGGVNCTYAHLSETRVNVGQEIGGEPMIQNTTAEFNRFRDTFQRLRGRDPSHQEFLNNAVGRTWLNVIEILASGDEAKSTQDDQEIGRVARRDKWDQQIYALQDQVKKLQAGESVTDAEIADLLKDTDAIRNKIANVKK